MHPVLRVEQQRLHAALLQPLKERGAQAFSACSDVRHGGRQLLAVPDEDQLLRAREQRPQARRLRRLRRLVDEALPEAERRDARWRAPLAPCPRLPCATPQRIAL